MADTIIADQARALKASALVAVLTDASATAATILHLDDAAWTQAAQAARVRAPSHATRALVARWFVERARAGVRLVRRPRRRAGGGTVNASEPLRAPAGACGWTPAAGWLYSDEELPRRVEGGGDMVLVVSADGMVRGVQPHAVAPLAAVLRIDADLAEVVARLDDLADRAHGLDVSEATDVNELRARVTALIHRVDRLEGRAP